MKESTRERKTLESRERINEICDRFEDSWSVENPPRIEDFVESDGSLSPADRGELLAELIRVDVALREASGDVPRLQQYLFRFPRPDRPLVVAAFRERSLHGTSLAPVSTEFGPLTPLIWKVCLTSGMDLVIACISVM